METLHVYTLLARDHVIQGWNHQSSLGFSQNKSSFRRESQALDDDSGSGGSGDGEGGWGVREDYRGQYPVFRKLLTKKWLPPRATAGE